MMKTDTILAWLLMSMAICSAAPALAEQYRDTRTGLIIHFPSGWMVNSRAPGFAITSFPLAKRPPQVVVPMNNAEIGIFAPPAQERNATEWMRSDRITEDLGYHIKRYTMTTKHLGTLEITEARAQPSVIPQGMLVVYFFEVKGQVVKASLVYRGQKQADHFELVFNSIIESLEPA